MDKIPIIAVVGPTASGKTMLAAKLAKAENAEVISFDSMQIYKELSISTAKPTKDEMLGVKHHFIGNVSVTENYSVAKFCEQAHLVAKEILNRGKNIVLVGGTGLYLDSFVNNIDFSDNKCDELRKKIDLLEEQNGAKWLYDELQRVDPISAKIIHPNNIKRIKRALEIYYSSGVSKSKQDVISKSTEDIYDCLYIGLNYKDRSVLHNRINKRVDIMIENGLVSEVESFYKIENLNTSLQAIGCKEIKPYIDGKLSLDECAENLKTATRRYAKRQLTWFRKNEEINWFYPDEMDFSDILKNSLVLANNFLKE